MDDNSTIDFEEITWNWFESFYFFFNIDTEKEENVIKNKPLVLLNKLEIFLDINITNLMW